MEKNRAFNELEILSYSEELNEWKTDLQTSEGRYKALFNSMDDAFAVIEMIFDENDKPVDWRYIETNKAFEKHLGWNDVQGKLVSNFLKEGIDNSLQLYGHVALTGESVRFEDDVRILNKWYDINAFKLGGEDSLIVAVIFKEITKRKHAEQLLNFQDSLLISVHDAMVAVDTNNIIVYWNKMAEKIFGWSVHEAMGRTTFEVFPSITPSMEDAYARLKSEESFDMEVDFYCKSGRMISTEARTKLLYNNKGEFNGWISTFRDITERKGKEKELQNMKDILALEVEALKMLHSVSSIIFSSGNLQYLYDKILSAATSLTKADRGHLGMMDKYGRFNMLAQESLIDDLTKKLVNTNIHRTITSDSIDLKSRIIIEDISEYSIVEKYPYLTNVLKLGIKTIQSTPMINDSGRVLGTLTTQYKTLHHFTERELQLLDLLANEAAELIERFNAEEALRQSEKRALALVDELRKLDENKNQFLRILSHELRNPLTSIMMSLSLLNKQCLNDDSQKAVDIMTRQTYQLSSLVEDLLDVTRIRQNKISLKKERVNLNEIISKAVLDNSSHFANKDVKLTSELPSIAIYIEVDPERITQVIGNLLHNASKFTSQGDYAKVSVWGNNDTKEAVIEVEDSGLGIDPDVLPDLFLPFMQVDRTLDRSQGGLGLGLSIVKGIVELHGGSVSIHSEGVGKGSKLTIRLPKHDEQMSYEKKKNPVSNIPSRSLRILVIDDIPDVVEILSSILRIQGHEVISALSGIDGIAKAKDFLPDVILSDIGLPIMNGYEVAKSIRNDSELKNTYLVALSGYAQTNDIEKAKEAGFDKHVAKPVDMEILQKVLDEVI